MMSWTDTYNTRILRGPQLFKHGLCIVSRHLALALYKVRVGLAEFTSLAGTSAGSSMILTTIRVSNQGDPTLCRP